jgi:sugar phosphate isomerase/epimerase
LGIRPIVSIEITRAGQSRQARRRQRPRHHAATPPPRGFVDDRARVTMSRQPRRNRMVKLAAFADEISPQLDEQIAFCKKNQITHFELRGVYGRNVLDFDKPLREEIKAKLAANGMGVASIGSPIGKVKITEPWPVHFERFKIAVDTAEFFAAPMIRVFSYYPPEGGNILEFKQEVISRFRIKCDYVKDRNVTLVHENERHIYGEKGRECKLLMKEINSTKLRSAFDFANFVQAGERPMSNWPSLKPFTTHIHVKDALLKDGKVVPAGEGDGDIAPILRDAYAGGYRGFLSLEPHLAAHGHFSGPQLFQTAVDALKKICRAENIPLAGAEV